MFDSSPACLHGLCFWLPVPIRWLVGPGCRRGLSVLARAVSRRAPGSWTTPGLTKASRLRSGQCGLPVTSTRSAPELRFRSSIPGPSMPLSTLHPAPRGTSARLEVKMVRYSFLVGLFHPRLHAGLSRRLRLLTRAAQYDSACYKAATVRERWAARGGARRQRPRKCSIPAATIRKPVSTQLLNYRGPQMSEDVAGCRLIGARLNEMRSAKGGEEVVERHFVAGVFD